MWFLVAASAMAVTWSGGDYGGADVLVASGDVLDGTLVNVGVFTVPAGATVTLAGEVPLVIEALEIVVDGHLNGNGAGFPANPSLPGDGRGPGGGGGGGLYGDAGAGGAGYGGSGGRGEDIDPNDQIASTNPIPGGRRYGSVGDPIDAPLGSSGGNGDVMSGGAGGGSITLVADLLLVGSAGEISVDGGAGTDAGFVFPSYGAASGGGSGGTLVIDATLVTLDGLLSAAGGQGGFGEYNYDGYMGDGGGGGGGRIKIYGSVTGNVERASVEGGAGGQAESGGHDPGRKGGRGTVYVDDWLASAPVASVFGQCGVDQGLEVSGATPLGDLLVLTGATSGSDRLPAGGPCEGLTTGLSGLVTVGRMVAGEDGTRRMRASCDRAYQVVDLWTCTITAVVGPRCYGDPATGDSDADGVCDDLDACPSGSDREDPDHDGVPSACDECPEAATGDTDGDGWCDDVDTCAGYDDDVDVDADAVPDDCDDCPAEYDPLQGAIWSVQGGSDPGTSLLDDDVRSTFAADLDGDGDADALAATAVTVTWIENLGGGVFGASRLVTTQVAYGRSVYAADLDSDGDIDVLSASDVDDKVAWYANLGGGSFGPQRVISTQGDSPTSVYAADLDGDGDPDVLSASAWDGEIAWIQNLGAGVFGARVRLTGNAFGADEVLAGDLDADGDLDVISAATDVDEVAWFENLGAGTFGAKQIVTATADGVGSIHTGDLDGDGDLDVLSAARYGDTVAWHENVGGAFVGHAVDAAAENAGAVHAADLDGDGDSDVVWGAAYGQFAESVVWHENLGGGAFGPAQVMTSASGAVSLHSADLDADGDPDLLAAGNELLPAGTGSLRWFENLASERPSDLDADGTCDASDLCPLAFDPDQLDTDGDGLGDVCDP